MFLFYFIVSKLGKQVLERHMLFFYYIGTIFKRKTILICHPFPDLPLKKMMLPSILGSVSCLPVTLLFTVLQKDTVPSPHPPPTKISLIIKLQSLSPVSLSLRSSVLATSPATIPPGVLKGDTERLQRTVVLFDPCLLPKLVLTANWVDLTSLIDYLFNLCD